MKRSLSAVLLALTLLLTGACQSSQSGGNSNPDNQVDQAPGVEADDPEELRDETETPEDLETEEAD